MLTGNAAMDAAGRGVLELHNLTFRYPLRPNVPVLRDVSLKLQKGAVTALVGRRFGSITSFHQRVSLCSCKLLRGHSCNLGCADTGGCVQWGRQEHSSGAAV